jgi:hypothetical protein
MGHFSVETAILPGQLSVEINSHQPNHTIGPHRHHQKLVAERRCGMRLEKCEKTIGRVRRIAIMDLFDLIDKDHGSAVRRRDQCFATLPMIL